MSSLLSSLGLDTERQPCCRIVDPTTHSGAVCKGAAAAWLDTACLGLSGGLEEWEKSFSQWYFYKPPQARLGPSSSQRARGAQGEVGVRPHCPQLLPQPHRGLSPQAEALPQPCLSMGARHGTRPREPGVLPRGPRTAAAVTPTCSHISHTNRSLRQVLIQFVTVSITTSQRFLVLSVATRMPSFGV